MSLIKSFSLLKQNLGKEQVIRDILKTSSWHIIDKILRLSLGLFLTVWTARYFGSDLFGLLNYSNAIISIIAILSGLGLQSIVVKELVQNPDQEKEIIGSSFFAVGVFSIFNFGTLFIIQYVLKTEKITSYLLIILGTQIIWKSTEVIGFWFESKTKIKSVILTSQIGFLIAVILKMIMLKNNASAVHYAFAISIEFLIGSIGLIYVFNSLAIPVKNLKISLTILKKLLKESFPLLISSLAVIVYMRIDQIMLKHFLGNEDVGFYTVALRISETWYFIPMAIMVTLRPSIIKLRAINYKLYEQSIILLTSTMLIITIGGALLVILAKAFIIITLFGQEFNNSIKLLEILIWSGIFVGIGLTRGVWLLAEGKQKFDFIFLTIGAVLNILLNIFLIQKFKSQGAAYATLITQIFIGFVAPILFKETRKSFFLLLSGFQLFKIISRLKEFKNLVYDK